MMKELYRPYDYERKTFGEHWCGPEAYPAWEKTLVAVYEKDEGSDGQNARIYCTAAPARFYEVQIEAGENSVGEPLPAARISTGSGAHQLAADIALAVSQGMLSFKSDNYAPHNPSEAEEKHDNPSEEEEKQAGLDAYYDDMRAVRERERQ